MPGMDVVVHQARGACATWSRCKAVKPTWRFPGRHGVSCPVGQLEGQSRRTIKYAASRCSSSIPCSCSCAAIRTFTTSNRCASIGLASGRRVEHEPDRADRDPSLGLDVTEVHIDGLDPSIASLAAGQVDAPRSPAIRSPFRLLSAQAPGYCRCPVHGRSLTTGASILPADRHAIGPVRWGRCSNDRSRPDLICRGDLDKAPCIQSRSLVRGAADAGHGGCRAQGRRYRAGAFDTDCTARRGSSILP